MGTPLPNQRHPEFPDVGYFQVHAYEGDTLRLVKNRGHYALNVFEPTEEVQPNPRLVLTFRRQVYRGPAPWTGDWPFDYEWTAFIQIGDSAKAISSPVRVRYWSSEEQKARGYAFTTRSDIHRLGRPTSLQGFPLW